MATKNRKTRLMGRDKSSGRFKSVRAARRAKKGSIVQRIRLPRRSRKQT